MAERWTFHDAVFAHWKGGITVFGFAYKTADGIENGTGHHTRIKSAWLDGITLHFESEDGRNYCVSSWKRAEFSDAPDAYDEVLKMARGNHES